MIDDVLLHLSAQSGHIINRLPSVGGVGNTETEIEVETLDQLISKVVALDHSESRNGLGSNAEDEFGTNDLLV